MIPGRTLKITIAWGFLVCPVGLGQTVGTSYRPGTDFSKYHSYKWVTVKGGQHGNPSLDAQIRQSFDAQLAAKSLKKTDGDADLNIEYQVAISKAEVWQTYEDWTITGIIESRLPQRRLLTIDVGTLALDMYDSAAKQLVWTGRADNVIDPKSSESERKKTVDKAAQKLLKEYPPK